MAEEKFREPLIKPKTYLIKREGVYWLELDDKTPTHKFNTLEDAVDAIYFIRYGLVEPVFVGLNQMIDIEFKLSNRDMEKFNDIRMIGEL